MVTTWVICWLVIHTSNNGLDNRSYRPVRGYIMREGGNDKLVVNFHQAFKEQNVNPTFNEPMQWVKDNECSYEP